MNEAWYRILRRLFDLTILLLFVIILLPDHWYRKPVPVHAVEKHDLETPVVPVLEKDAKLQDGIIEDKKVEAIENNKVEDLETTENEIIEEIEHVAEEVKELVDNKTVVDSSHAEPKPEVWWLQIGVFKDMEAASKPIAKLKKANIKYKTEKLGKMIMLKVGPFQEKQLDNAIKKVQSVGLSNWIKTRN